uniref:Protein kinase domain-containing protein n=1 Tax=viral metagenome TaxID=1070528 RepID=A0A6C0I2J7_9ZZZZ
MHRQKAFSLKEELLPKYSLFNSLHSNANGQSCADWFLSQYIEAVGFNNKNFSEKFKSFIENNKFPKNEKTGINHLPISGIRRIESFLYLKYKYPLNSDGYVCGVLWAEINDGKKNIESHYAYAYWRANHDDILVSNDPEYISISPTYDSRDGEYRKRFIKYDTFLLAYSTYGKELSEFENIIYELISNKELALNLNFYPYDEPLAKKYKHSRLLLKVFAYALALDLWEYYTGLILEHTNSKYRKLLFLIGEDYPELINLSKKLLQKKINIRIDFADPKFSTEVKCGQKIVPLYYTELMKVGDYNLPAWKETNVSKVMSDLVINYITPSFPLYNDWAYINDSDLNLYENDAMHDRYALSDVISHTVHDVRSAREKIQNMNTKISDRIIGTELFESDKTLGGCNCYGCNSIEGGNVVSMTSFIQDNKYAGGTEIGGNGVGGNGVVSLSSFSDSFGGSNTTADTNVEGNAAADSIKLNENNIIGYFTKSAEDSIATPKEYTTPKDYTITTPKEKRVQRDEFMASIVETGIEPNYRTNEFNAHLYEDIEYAHTHLILSNVSLLHTMEDVGWTLYSVNNYITKTLVHPPVIRELMTNKKVAYHYIFNYLYGAYCMHTKMHIVHSDIHSNNLTINLWGEVLSDVDEKLFNYKDSFDKFYKNATTVYATGFQDDEIYLFPATGINATIIDFSRVIIGPNFRKELESDGRGPQYATNFYHDQVNKILNAFNRYAPAFVEKNQEPIKAAILANFELVFPVLCCIDFMAIGGCLINFFEKTIAEAEKCMTSINADIIKGGDKKNKKKKKTKKTIFSTIKESNKLLKSNTPILKSSKGDLLILDKFIPIPLVVDDSNSGGSTIEEKIQNFRDCLELSQNIEKMGRELLIKGLSSIVGHIKGKEECPKIEYPGKLIISSLFKEFSFSNVDNNIEFDIVDGYNYTNELKYSNADYRIFPPWANIETIKKNLYGYKLEDLLPFGVENFLNLKEKTYTYIAAEAAKAESNKLDGDPMYTASSWIEK